MRPYSKRELAMAYAPDISPSSALNRLAGWVRHHRRLSDELDETGYQNRQRIFTSLQVELIFRYSSTFAFACVYRHRFMRILTLAHTYIAVALYGRRREAMPMYVWSVRVMQIMQVMQHLFSHTRAYILKKRRGRGIMFSYNPLVFLPFGRFSVSANVASNCMRCFWVSSASRLLPRGIDR